MRGWGRRDWPRCRRQPNSIPETFPANASVRRADRLSQLPHPLRAGRSAGARGWARRCSARAAGWSSPPSAGRGGAGGTSPTPGTLAFGSAARTGGPIRTEAYGKTPPPAAATQVFGRERSSPPRRRGLRRGGPHAGVRRRGRRPARRCSAERRFCPCARAAGSLRRGPRSSADHLPLRRLQAVLRRTPPPGRRCSAARARFARRPPRPRPRCGRRSSAGRRRRPQVPGPRCSAGRRRSRALPRGWTCRRSPRGAPRRRSAVAGSPGRWARAAARRGREQSVPAGQIPSSAPWPGSPAEEPAGGRDPPRPAGARRPRVRRLELVGRSLRGADRGPRRPRCRLCPAPEGRSAGTGERAQDARRAGGAVSPLGRRARHAVARADPRAR